VIGLLNKSNSLPDIRIWSRHVSACAVFTVWVSIAFCGVFSSVPGHAVAQDADEIPVESFIEKPADEIQDEPADEVEPLFEVYDRGGDEFR